MGCACQFPTPKHGNGDLAWSCQDEQSFHLWRGQLAGRWLLRLFQTLHLLPQLFSAQMPDQVIVGAISKGFIHLVLLGRLGQDEDFGVLGRRACLHAPATTSSCAPSTNSVPSGPLTCRPILRTRTKRCGPSGATTTKDVLSLSLRLRFHRQWLQP